MPESDYDIVSLDHAAEPVFGAQRKGPHVLRTHPETKCHDETCVIHNPSDHHMRTWPLNWRADTQVMERICPHGVGHPDPDATAYAMSQGQHHYGNHGCDGCCHEDQGL
jgi:hypothetical protein